MARPDMAKKFIVLGTGKEMVKLAHAASVEDLPVEDRDTAVEVVEGSPLYEAGDQFIVELFNQTHFEFE